ncbi:hypothetical protein U1E44_05820 [Arenibacter sp. GZD96]|uniref:hypothetical protein n=1 Tax=Aurantibrevibacter litoralis TaxID=3106030 RepID=UPI002AFEB891|nr:hypothetical protein [Arenibacter sp. GZD-96]MEA1785599.1 hypothetical protein [Arenibacter sp. GZD-96]
MIKILRYTEYLYLVIAVISFYKLFELWNTDRDKSYMFVFFALVSLGMFLFRRNYRKKFEQRKRDNN